MRAPSSLQHRSRRAALAVGLGAVFVASSFAPAHAEGVECKGYTATYDDVAEQWSVTTPAGQTSSNWNVVIMDDASGPVTGASDIRNLIIGTSGDDTITGGNLRDVVCAGQGEDSVAGGEGNDILDGGQDDDTVHGNQGIDEVYGGEGDDTLTGGPRGDYLEGGPGSDSLTGNAGADTFVAGPTNGPNAGTNTCDYDASTDVSAEGCNG